MLSTAIQSRAGSRDPDSLFGCLIYLEAGGTIKQLNKLAKSRVIQGFVEKARNGDVGRVEAFKGDEFQLVEFPDGLFAIRWQRELLALLLRPDGVSTDEIETAMATMGQWNAPMAISRLRIELKPFSIKIDSDRIEGRNDFRYRITGTSNWRMQKIISNGWSL